MLRRHIGNYNFVGDVKTGITLRWGKTINDNPVFAPVPELADISISNHCTKGCSFCYKNSKPNQEFMSIEDYCYILDSMNHHKYGNVFQVAIGGGEPLEHPDFLSIIDKTLEHGIVPNFTTNGLNLTSELCKELKNKIGAVALSITSIDDIFFDKVSLLIKENIRVNIHYVLSSQNIKEAISIVSGEKNKYFKGINAIIFLTYKPAGRANIDNILKDDYNLNIFLNKIGQKNIIRPKIGFDACFVPMLLYHTDISPDLIDTCEGGFFSVYIDHNLNVSPCSFSNNSHDLFNLREYDFYDIWLDKLKVYRIKNKNKCRRADCPSHKQCRGCCSYYPEITTCYVG